MTRTDVQKADALVVKATQAVVDAEAALVEARETNQNVAQAQENHDNAVAALKEAQKQLVLAQAVAQEAAEKASQANA